MTEIKAGHGLDGAGGGVRFGTAEMLTGVPTGAPTGASTGVPTGAAWLHLDRTRPETRSWLETRAEIPPAIREALLEEDTRPRCVVTDTGMLLILRGLNFDRAQFDEDTVAVRLWAGRALLIVLTRYRVLAIEDLTHALDRGEGPRDVADFLIRLIDRLTARIGPEVDRMEEELDRLEEAALDGGEAIDRRGLAAIRRRSLVLHRYLHPQRQALQDLREHGRHLLPALEGHGMTETLDRVTRLVEDLTALRDRAQIVEDGIAIRVAERMNRNMYWLSIVATIFMPLGFITGLLGVNLLGIPGAEDPTAFLVLCGLLALLVAVELLVMRRLRLF